MANANETIEQFEAHQKLVSTLSSDNHPRPRFGKTAKDKARGHIPYRKNRRVWNGNARDGKWIKA